MMNAFEFQNIKMSGLPAEWREAGALEELEQFLQDSWQLREIFYADRHVTGRQQFIDFDRRDGFKTRNYIGTITFRGTQLNIFPKIYREDEDDYDAGRLTAEELLHDLVIWLGYCDRFHFPFVSMRGEMEDCDTLLELLITAYVHYVRSVIVRQPFFRYEEVEEVGSTPKGKIDFRDYALVRCPSGARNKLKYAYSDFLFDNLLNRIIKCTCRMLAGMTSKRRNRAMIRDILLRLGEVGDVACMPHDCDRVHLNPLQTGYSIILSMSKLFLLNKTTSHHMGMAETFCFLFPAELLFEGFIGGFIREHFKNKVKITTQARDIYLTELTVNGEIIGNRFLLKEDIVIQNGDSILILDTKYKEIERLSRARTEDGKLGITDADMKQMAVYASRRGAERLYLLYPLYRGAKPDTTEVIFHIIIGNGSAQRKIPLQILQVPFALGEDPEEAKRLLLRTLSDAVRVDGPPVSSFRRNFEKTLPSEFQYGIINHA